MAQSNLCDIQSLTILNWNANGLKKQQSIFSAFLVRHNVDIACVSETHLVHTESLKISGYAVYREDRLAPVASGGVAILIKKKITHHSIFLPELSNLEATAIKLNLENGSSLIVASAYKPPNRRLLKQDIDIIFSFNLPTLLFGDLNCKNQLWGCRSTNPNGNRLYQIISDTPITVIAPDEPTFYPTQNNYMPDVLDIILQKSVTIPIFQQVLPELDSDHCPVVISFMLPAQFDMDPRRLITGHVDWDTFGVRLDEILAAPRLTSTEDIDLYVKHFTECLTSATKLATYKTFRKKNNNFLHPPSRILNLIKQKHSVRRQWQRQRHPWLRRRLNYLTRLVQTELNEFRYNNYKNYVKDINPNDSSLWQATKRILRSPTVIPPLQSNGALYQNDLEKCEVFADYFEEAFTPNNIVDQRTNDLVLEHLESPELTAELPIKFSSPQEIKQFISKLPLKKAPGPDLIPNVVLKNLTRKGLVYFTSLCNACLSLGYFPSSWKEAEISVIHKPNKPKQFPSSYRPISLLSCLSKILEKIIQKRLIYFTEATNAVPPYQFGFRPHHSTVHQLLRISETIVRGFERKEHSTVAFLDVGQAFDKVWHNGLFFKLKKIGLPKYLQLLLKSFLNNRSFRVKINNSLSSAKPILSGVPQGSILGPLLFNIFLSDMPVPIDAELALYADDTAIITQHADIDRCKDLLQQSVDLIVNWFTKWRLNLNPTKCEAKIFSLRRSPEPNPISINNTNIIWNPSDRAVKYLGVYLDKKLNWNFHINSKLTQAYSRLSSLFPILNRKSSLQNSCAILIYKTILRPLIMYASPVWGLSISTQKMNKIQVFQNKVLRIATKSPWFVRNLQIHRETGMDSISTFLRRSTQRCLVNLDSVSGARFFNIGHPTNNRRLKAKLPQDF